MTNTPVVFIHGLWLHATSWEPWQNLFRDAGYDPIAPGWPQEPDTVAEARANPEHVANIGIDDAVGHYADIIDAIGTPAVIIGHSFGGLIAEKLLGQDLAAAAVAIDPAQIKGVLPLPLAQLRAGLPALGNPANLHKAMSLTKKEFRFGFGNAVTEEESDALFDRWTIPSRASTVPGRCCELCHALPGEGKHREPDTRPSSLGLWHGGPHGPRRRHSLDPQAVSRLSRGHSQLYVRVGFDEAGLVGADSWLRRALVARACSGLGLARLGGEVEITVLEWAFKPLTVRSRIPAMTSAWHRCGTWTAT